jgi:MFS family permease
MTNNNVHIQKRKRLLFFAICGIIPLLLVFLWLIIAAILAPGYTGSIYISPISVGFYAMIQNFVFVVLGLLTIGLAIGLQIGLSSPKNRLLKIGVWSVIIFSLGILFAGLLPLAGVVPENYIVRVPYNLLSAIAFAVTFGAYIAAQLLIGKGLKKENSVIWSKYSKYSFRSGLLYIILVILLILTILFDIYPGGSQRVFFMVSWVWILLTGIKLYLISTNRKPISNRWI